MENEFEQSSVEEKLAAMAALADEDQAVIELRRAFQTIASIPDGIVVLRYIMLSAGFHDDLKRFDPQRSELNPYATVYNLAQRDLWLEVRKWLQPRQLQIIENPED